MTGLPRFAPNTTKTLKMFALAIALCLPARGSFAQPATAPAAADAPAVAVPPTPAATEMPAPPAGGQPAAAAAPSVAPEVRNAVDNYWHYGKIARYDLAAAEGQKVLASGADPAAILLAFEQVAAERQDNLDQWLLRWQGVDAMKDVTTQLIGKIAEGYRARRSSTDFITEQLDRVATGEARAYANAMSRLRESGELAVPMIIDRLRDPAKRSQQPYMRRALRDMGRYALNPLVAATEMKDWDTLTVVVGVLGDLGYGSAAPYVARVFESQETPPTVKSAAADALSRLNVSAAQGNHASDLFYDLAEHFYYDTADIRADNRYPTANVWYWEGQGGLSRKEVPPEIFNEIMAMRACEYTLKLGGPRSDDSLSLWLASNYKRESELPQGATDATRPENYPPGHYWGVSGGAKYLESALARAVRDRSAPVAFRSIRSLQEIVGQSNLFSSGEHTSQPLINAMQFPDRKVRFEAAFALAAALPQQNYEGSQRVVPLLAEALSQTGQPSVVVVMPSLDDVNKLVDGLKQAGFAAAGAINAEGAAAVANTLPAVDVIVVSEDIGAGRVDQLFLMAGENAKLAGAARLVMTKTNASIYEPRKVNEPLLSTTTATDAATLKAAIEDAQKHAGSLPMDAAQANEYATRAAQLLLKIGISRSQVYDLMPAKASILSSLADARPDIIKLGGGCAAFLNDRDAQSGLLAASSEEKAADDVKISLYKSLALSAKLWGNLLDQPGVQNLEKVVAGATNLEVRSAAAEARGALNLPADQAKTLVVEQSKT
jgi:hypothetical protein